MIKAERIARSAWQVAETHEELINCASGLAPFANGPDHEGLASPHVAGCEHLGYVGRITADEFSGRLGVAARIPLHAEALEDACHGADESHREQHQVGLEHLLAARHLDHLA